MKESCSRAESDRGPRCQAYSCKGIRSLVKGQSVKGAERRRGRFPRRLVRTQYPGRRTDREREEKRREENETRPEGPVPADES